MAYQKKYYFKFFDLFEFEHMVELWQNTDDVLTAEEIKGHMNPFSVELPELDHKFQVVRGKGCIINLLSPTDMKFFDGLYHVNPTDFRVVHYIDSALNFLGYLNSEMMSEPYDINFNYPVSITGNDGFSLMDRFSFVQSDASIYTGIKSKFELLQIIFSKIGLPFIEYRIALSTTFTGYSGNTNSTILHESFVDCANFYNEDPAPMSLREVLESILAPYGAFITSEKGKIYIADVNTIANGGVITYKTYDYSTGNYTGQIAIPNGRLISNIGYFGTGQNIERSGGVNKQVVSYSPYPLKMILDSSLNNLSEFETVPISWSKKNDYFYKQLEGNKFWEIDSAKQITLNPTTFEASYFSSESDANIYLRYPTYGGLNGRIVEYIQKPYVNISGTRLSTSSVVVAGGGRRKSNYTAGVAFFITGEILVKTKNNPYDDTQKSSPIPYISLSYQIKVGDKYYNKSTRSWSTSVYKLTLPTSNPEFSTISDQFVAIGERGEGEMIYIGSSSAEIVLNGNLEFEIWSEHYTRVFHYPSDPGVLVTNNEDVQEVWLRNLQIKLVNFDGSEISDKDIHYIGLLDENFQNEGDEISLTCGTDSQFSDLGKILYSDSGSYKHILEWTRSAQTFKIEELLLNSLSSNYRAGFITLSGMKLKNSFSLMNIITDTFIGTAKMMVKAAKINYQDNVVECDFVEVFPDQLTIVPSSNVGS